VDFAYFRELRYLHLSLLCPAPSFTPGYVERRCLRKSRIRGKTEGSPNDTAMVQPGCATHAPMNRRPHNFLSCLLQNVPTLWHQINNMIITTNSAVYMHYTLRNAEGEVLDSSADSQPLAYIHGIGFLIPGLEKHMEGKQKGDRFQVSVEPAEGYGEHNEEMVLKAPRANFQGDHLEVGMEVELDLGEESAVALVTEISGDDVTLDLNHPLAGEQLFFDIEVVNVREASADELDHGHIHGPGGVHHH
jgi:FKBP-type peptidyl-prolyl cis-trans isomerase SlyD